MKNKIIYSLIFLLGICFFTGCTENDPSLLKGKHNVAIEIENYGTVEVELNADIAPITVTNFINLVKNDFYTGLTFHRIIPGFMIQGGDPLGTGLGGNTEKIKGEFSVNNVKNDIKHLRGVISMARQGGKNYNSASSQFFIVLEDSAHLDGEYASFGHVTKGMTIIDEVVKAAKIETDGQTVLKDNQPKITKISVITK